MILDKKTARIAGILYLIVIISGVFSEFFVRSKLIVPHSVTATVNNIKNHEILYRIGFVSDLIMMACYLLLAITLYMLFKSISNNYARLMLIFVIACVPVMFINMLNYIAPLLLLSGADYLTVIKTEHLHAQVMFFLKLYKHGYFIAQIFFGLWLLPLGILVIKSTTGFITKIIGMSLIVACIGYVIDLVIFFLFPQYHSIISPIVLAPAYSELAFCVWLLIKGIKD